MTSIDLLPIAAALTSFYILKKTSNPLNLFNPYVYFYWAYFIFCFIAVLYRDIYSYALSISNQTITLISLGIILYSAGGSIANHASPSRTAKKTIEQLISEASQKIPTNKYLVYLSISVPIFFSLLFTVKTGQILWLSDSFDDERVILRQGIGWISLLGISSAYLATIYSSIHFYKRRENIKLLISIIILATCSISYGNRAPALEVIVVGGFFAWISLIGRVKALHFLAGFLSLLTFVMVLGVIRQGLEFNFESIYKQMLWRPFTNIQNIEWITSFIPNSHDFFYGNSLIIDIAVILPGYQPNFGTYMKEIMGKDFSGGSITVSFLGQAYADFGFTFSLFVISLFGYIFQKFFLILSKNGKNLPLLIVISITSKSMASSGIISPLIYTLLPCLIFLASWIGLRQILRATEILHTPTTLSSNPTSRINIPSTPPT
ncbi:oligosaccharide repeat unit polymerase [compost metagenome]